MHTLGNDVHCLVWNETGARACQKDDYDDGRYGCHAHGDANGQADRLSHRETAGFNVARLAKVDGDEPLIIVGRARQRRPLMSMEARGPVLTIDPLG